MIRAPGRRGDGQWSAGSYDQHRCEISWILVGNCRLLPECGNLLFVARPQSANWMPMKRAAFFFGAGISRPSGNPLAAEITTSALSDQWHQHTDLNFYPGLHRNPAFVDVVTPTVQSFLAVVNKIAREYLAEVARTQPPREPHYEDLFSLAYQAFRPEVEHTPNLAVMEFLRRLRAETLPLHSEFRGGSSRGGGFCSLAETACDFLHWVVHHKLTAGGTRAGLDAITETAKHVDELDIFTLNHDLLIEAQLEDQGIAYEDGFADRHGELRAFSFWHAERREKVRLFKLHGSVDWFLYEFPGWARQYAIPDHDAFHSRDQNGAFVKPVEWKAAFLSGTIVKEQYYGTGLFGELFSAFRSHLGRHTHLICCGYGFGDPGVNGRIHQWLQDSLDRSNRLVVLNPGSDREFFDAKPFWLQDLHSHGRLIRVDKWLQHCLVDDLLPFFDV